MRSWSSIFFLSASYLHTRKTTVTLTNNCASLRVGPTRDGQRSPKREQRRRIEDARSYYAERKNKRVRTWWQPTSRQNMTCSEHMTTEASLDVVGDMHIPTQIMCICIYIYNFIYNIYMYIYIYIYLHIYDTRFHHAHSFLWPIRISIQGSYGKKIAGSADDSFIYMFIQVSSRGTPAGWKFLKKKPRETQRRSRRKVKSVDF